MNEVLMYFESLIGAGWTFLIAVLAAATASLVFDRRRAATPAERETRQPQERMAA